MDKKSALVTAGGLTASFVAGIAAVSFDWGMLGTSPVAAAPTTQASPARQKPIVKHRTIVVHKKAKPAKPSTASAPSTVTLPAPTSVAPPPSTPVAKTSGSATGGDDSGEHEGGGD